MRKLKMTSGVLQKISTLGFIAITWTQSPTVHAERRIISYSAEVHRVYQNNTYITGCIFGENIDDYWNVDGERELSAAWTRLHKIHFIERKAT